MRRQYFWWMKSVWRVLYIIRAVLRIISEKEGNWIIELNELYYTFYCRSKCVNYKLRAVPLSIDGLLFICAVVDCYVLCIYLLFQFICFFPGELLYFCYRPWNSLYLQKKVSGGIEMNMNRRYTTWYISVFVFENKKCRFRWTDIITYILWRWFSVHITCDFKFDIHSKKKRKEETHLHFSRQYPWAGINFLWQKQRRQIKYLQFPVFFLLPPRYVSVHLCVQY